MKNSNLWAIGMLSVCGGALVAVASGQQVTQSQQTLGTASELEVELFPTPPGPSKLGAYFDLKSGLGRVLDPQISIVAVPFDSDANGFYEAVVRVNLDPASTYTKLCVLADYEGVPVGITLNIGDSATNDGGGGDFGTQQRDAEMQIQGEVLSVFANDLGGTPPTSTRLTQSMVPLRDGAIKMTVADKFFCWGNGYSELSFKTAPPNADLLYALGGQPDSEGPTNYDIYVGLNRVIFGAPANGRIGSGLSRVYLTLVE